MSARTFVNKKVDKLLKIISGAREGTDESMLWGIFRVLVELAIISLWKIDSEYIENSEGLE